MDNSILTPSLIWKDFSAEGDLKISVIREQTEDGVLFREAYFNARKTEDGITRVYAVYACPAAQKKHPAVLYCHDFGSEVNKENLRIIAKAGYAALSFDYTGEREGVSRYTIYPKSIDYANFERAGRRMDHVDTNAKETALYEWTCVAKYAAKCLAAQPEADADKIAVLGIRRGGYLAWQLASFCSDVKAACSLFEGGWTDYSNRDKYDPDPEPEVLDEERQRWLAGLATQVYAAHVKVPFLYLGATNDALGRMDRVADTLTRIETESRWAFAERLCDMISDKCFMTLQLFLEKFLEGGELRYPEQPFAAFFVDGAALRIRLLADVSQSISRIRLYYAVGETNPTVRNWCALPAEQTPLGWEAAVPEYSGSDLIFCYGSVEYENGVYLTTNIAALRPSDTDAAKKNVCRDKILYNSAMGTDSFTVLSLNRKLQDNDLFVPNEPVKVEAGPFGICGISPVCFQLATFKVHDERYRGEDKNILKFDVACNVATVMTAVMIENFRKDNEKRYRSVVNLLGGELWQKVELSTASFKTEEGISLKNWETSEVLCFECGEKYLMNNMLWL